VIEAGAAYQIAKWWSGSGGIVKDANAYSRYTAIVLLAGARYWHPNMDQFALSGTLNTTGLEISGNRATARSGAVDWVDPLIRFRVRHQLAPGQHVLCRADVGASQRSCRAGYNLFRLADGADPTLFADLCTASDPSPPANGMLRGTLQKASNRLGRIPRQIRGDAPSHAPGRELPAIYFLFDLSPSKWI
jgi:hypothetical protein